MHARRNELLAEVAACAADTALALGLPEDVASQVGAAVADALADHWGGQVITIPKDHFYRLSKRDRVILEEHRQGTGYAALAKRYRMTERGIRALVRRARIRDRHLDQRELFNEGTS
jgi:Mor family transcriptional regulator